MADRAGLLGSLHRKTFVVSAGASRMSSTTVPRFARNRVHPFVSFALLQSFRALPAGPVKSRLPSLGFSLPFATSTCRVHSREHPKLASFRPRSFALPRRLAPLLALRVCFTPQPRTGFPFRGFPSDPADHLVDGPCPLAVRPRTLPRLSPRRHVTRPRLQGFAPRRNPSRPAGV